MAVAQIDVEAAAVLCLSFHFLLVFVWPYGIYLLRRIRTIVTLLGTQPSLQYGVTIDKQNGSIPVITST